MSTDISGMIECRPGARIWGLDDEDSVWEVGIDLYLLNQGNAYDGLACLFGVRNSYGFRPWPRTGASRMTPRMACGKSSCGYGGSPDVYGTTWLTWAELNATDWQETCLSGTRTRASAAGIDTAWGRVWSVMRTLSEVHGAENVRLVAWFH